MLTDAKARNAKPADKPYKLTDAGGLYLHVTTAGGKIWRVRYEIAGKEKLLTVGPYPAIGLAEARAARDAAKLVLRAGKDPAVERKIAATAVAADTANTFEVIARAWHKKHAPSWRARHADDVITSLERDIFSAIGSFPIRSITVPMVRDAILAIENRPAPETARRVRQRVSAVFCYAVALGLAENDPAAVVKGAMAPLMRGRQPAVTDLDGVRAILMAAEAIPAQPGTRLALRLLALTACRPGELRGVAPAEFEGLDGAEPTWRISAERMKAKREHVVPLSRQAVATVKVAMALIGRGPLLFPSVRHAHRPLSENAIGYMLNRAGYHGQHVPHGFHAAFSSIMNERHRTDRAVIDLMLAHALKDKTEAAYNRALHMPRRRELAQEWADLLLDGMPEPAALLKAPRRPSPAAVAPPLMRGDPSLHL